ncbi:protein of unknown function [Hyphomicrobium sp. 1Nfss2.1]
MPVHIGDSTLVPRGDASESGDTFAYRARAAFFLARPTLGNGPKCAIRQTFWKRSARASASARSSAAKWR